ncbi:MAG: hypothetical protein LBU61_00815 [Coriobacteriales bacterium]|nr:hypothetical protein [Coriobacteriales bacterium]
MKKRIAIVVAGVMIFASMALVLSGCDTKGEPVDYAGKYILTKADVSGVGTVEGEDITKMFPPSENYIEIVDSRNIIFVLQNEKIETTYTKDGSILHVSDGGDVLDFTFDGKQVTYYVEDQKTTLFFTK